MNKQASGENWFVKARYGLFIHYGIYSMLGRGEWVMNRERMSRSDMEALAARFDPSGFDAGAICDLAVAGGMKYVNLTTMHHDGFRLYDTELSDFNSMRFCKRDLVAELVAAARERGLRVALYHTQNQWYDQPDAVDALESKDAYDVFIEKTFARLRELVTRFNPIDVMWYDGWWPFNARGWQAEKMNEMVRSIQPDILINGRNGLPGDFSTPEGHMSAPSPWRPWEACMTLNNHWGFHRGDHKWKAPDDVVGLLAIAAARKGNLLLNIGPRGDGSVPDGSASVIHRVGEWLTRNGECIFDTDPFTFSLMTREGHNGDWNSNGPFTLKGKNLYQLVRYWPGPTVTIAGLNTRVKRVSLLGVTDRCAFNQQGERVVVSGLPDNSPDPVCPVLRFECEEVPEMYLTGGMRVPKAVHPPYDPVQSDIAGDPR